MPSFNETEKYLKKLGFPRFPPKSSPKHRRDWWREPRSVLPTSGAYEFGKPFSIEITGTPKAGKTETDKLLRPLIEPHLSACDVEKYGLWNVLVVDEQQKKRVGPDGSIVLEVIKPPSFNPKHDYNEELKELGDIPHSWLVQFFKSLWWRDIRKKIANTEKTGRGMYVQYRGIIDALIWTYAMGSHNEDKRFSLRNSRYGTDFESPHAYEDLLSFAGAQIRTVSAIILFGTSQEEAVRRSDKKYGVAPSPFFKELSNWYEYFIDNVFPRLHKIFGTGLLVINGEDTPVEKAMQVYDYLRQAADLEKLVNLNNLTPGPGRKRTRKRKR